MAAVAGVWGETGRSIIQHIHQNIIATVEKVNLMFKTLVRINPDLQPLLGLSELTCPAQRDEGKVCSLLCATSRVRKPNHSLSRLPPNGKEGGEVRREGGMKEEEGNRKSPEKEEGIALREDRKVICSAEETVEK